MRVRTAYLAVHCTQYTVQSRQVDSAATCHQSVSNSVQLKLFPSLLTPSEISAAQGIAVLLPATLRCPNTPLMGGRLLAWRWGLNTEQTTVKKERNKSVNKSGKFRKVRFLENSGNSSVVNDKEQKRVWFSRLWFSIRRKQHKRKSGQEMTSTGSPSALVDIQCEYFFISDLITSRDQHKFLLGISTCVEHEESS